jgi:hypothetical protein
MQCFNDYRELEEILKQRFQQIIKGILLLKKIYSRWIRAAWAREFGSAGGS